MTCAEIKISIHDYVDGQLDLVSKKQVQDHLSKCDKCFREYQRLQDFFNVLRRLPYTLEPNEDIIASFSRELLQRSNQSVTDNTELSRADRKKITKEEKRQEKRLKAEWSVIKKSKTSKTINHHSRIGNYYSPRADWGKMLLLPIVMVIIGAAYFVYDFQKRNSPWNIEVIEGEISINGSSTDASKLSQGQTLATIDSSSVFLSVPNTGKIEIAPNSSIVLVKAKEDDNRIKLERGSIKVIGSVDMPNLTVELYSVLVSNRSGIFTITTNDKNSATLVVQNGFVEIEYGEEIAFVKDGYACKIKKGRQPGLPYRIEASDSLKKEIEKFDYAIDNEILVKNLISISGKEDVLTLMALLPRVAQQERQILFQAIANYYQPPVGVTRMGILKADKDMIYTWWEDIEWQL
jgi:hypothetical protein